VHPSDWDADTFVASHAPGVNPTGQHAGLTPAAAAGSSQQQPEGPSISNGRQLGAQDTSRDGQRQVVSARDSCNAQSSHATSCTYGPFGAKAHLTKDRFILVNGLSAKDIMEDYAAGTHAYVVVLQQQVGVLHLHAAALRFRQEPAHEQSTLTNEWHMILVCNEVVLTCTRPIPGNQETPKKRGTVLLYNDFGVCNHKPKSGLAQLGKLPSVCSSHFHYTNIIVLGSLGCCRLAQQLLCCT
jgi:hypothetical protein